MKSPRLDAIVPRGSRFAAVRRFLLYFVLIALTGVGLAVLVSPGRGRLSTTPRVTPSEVSGGAAARLHALVNSRTEAAIHGGVFSGDCTVRVLDLSTDNPIAGARLVRNSPNRTLQVGETINMTDSRGLTVLTPSDCDLVVSAAGYVAHALRINPGEQTRTVHMRSAASVEVACLDPRGEPVEGCRIALSRCALPKGLASVDSLASVSFDAIHPVITDALGRALVDGLDTGAYYYHAEKDAFCLVDAPNEPLWVSDRSTLRIVMAPILVGVFGVAGDRVIGSSFIVDGESCYLPRDGSSEFLDGLERAYPEFACIAVANVNADSSAATMQLLLESRGYARSEVTLVPAGEFLGPDVIPANALGEPVAMGGVWLEVVDPDGMPSAARGFYTEVGPRRMDAAVVELEPGKPHLLPTGRHPLRNHSKWVEAAMGVTVVQSPGVTTVNLAESFRECELYLLDPRGEEVRGCVLEIAASSEVHVIRTDWRNPVTLWLPIGSAEVEVRAPGWGTKKLTLQIMEGPGKQSIPIHLADAEASR